MHRAGLVLFRLAGVPEMRPSSTDRMDRAAGFQNADRLTTAFMIAPRNAALAKKESFAQQVSSLVWLQP